MIYKKLFNNFLLWRTFKYWYPFDNSLPHQSFHRNQLFSVEDTIKIPKDRLKSITNFQYEKLLLCEFILTPQST